ncbi:MAG: hypothetical protein KDD48_01945 [Bdellovibrionales bacterium]|nr:hypothetical protein [Bdellovibrionales bacterium]
MDSIKSIWFDFSSDVRGTLGKEYLPIRDMSFMFDYALFNENPKWYHVENVLLYSIDCALLFIFLCTFFTKPPFAFAATLFFIFHPSHVESVAWISERKSLLSFAFLFLGLILALKNLSKKTKYSLGLGFALICFSLAIFSKSTAIIYGPLLLLLITLKTSHLFSAKKTKIFLGIVFFQTCAHLALAIGVGKQIGMIKTWMGNSIQSHFLTVPYLYAKYLMDTFFPLKIKPLVEISPVKSWMSVYFIAPYLLLVIALVICAYYKKKRNVWSFSLLWFWILLLPVLQIVPIPNRYALRYLFLPSTMLCFVVLGLIQTSSLKKYKIAVVIGLTVYLGFFITQSSLALPMWKNCETLWEKANVYPDHQKRVMTSLFKCYKNTGRHEKAKILGHDLLVKFPRTPEILTDLGSIALLEGQFDTARTYFLAAYHVHHNQNEYENNMAISFLRQGHVKKARFYLIKILKRDPTYAPAKKNLDAIQSTPKKPTRKKRKFSKQRKNAKH